MHLHVSLNYELNSPNLSKTKRKTIAATWRTPSNDTLGEKRRNAVAYQQNQDRRIRRHAAVVAGDPIEGDGAAVARAEALPPEPDVREGPEERGEDRLHVAVPADDGERGVRPAERRQRREEEVAAPAEDLEGGVGPGHGGAGADGGDAAGRGCRRRRRRRRRGGASGGGERRRRRRRRAKAAL